MDIPLTVEVIIGSTTMLLKDLLNIGPGSVIELDREINEPVDIRVNGKLMAQGELVVIGEKFGVRITEIYKEEKKNIFRETLQERVRK
jgi:flagellar motor switch protein FliN/FliY